MSKDAEEMAGELRARGMRHGHIHPQVEPHYHGHWHGHMEAHDPIEVSHGRRHQGGGATHRDILAIRSHSGVAGDMILAGLALLTLESQGISPDSPQGRDWLQNLCASLLPSGEVHVALRRKSVNSICGWHLDVQLPHSHEHRGLAAIAEVVTGSAMHPESQQLAMSCFYLLAECEADAHGIPPEEVHFHEVGAMDSILDICACCELYHRLHCPEIHCGSLPLADGQVQCAHGTLPVPAPAVLCLLRGVPVHPYPGDARAGELLTPTGVALLKTFNARFGGWPALHLETSVTVYGSREFSSGPNGLIFVRGRPLDS